MHLAERDERIRAILLQGSRANNKITPDALQDFDVLMIVDQMKCFLDDHQWTSIFGERVIWQLPDEMKSIGNNEKSNVVFHYLMQFKDGNRIDLTLFPKEKMKTDFVTDSLSLVWLDKDGLFSGIEPPSDKDYLIRKPVESEFLECCNEFWWVCTYISKGLRREEITYAKAMMEGPVRQMFMRMIAWYIGVETEFSVSFGNEGKMMKKYLDKESYSKILKTYPDYGIKNIWHSLFIMTSLFGKYAVHVSRKLQFNYNIAEQVNVEEWLHQQHESK